MPILKANQRRRRLRLIKSIEDHTAQQFRSAVSALTIASDTEFARVDGDAIRQKLLVECQVKTNSVLRIEHPGAAPLEVAMNRPSMLIGSDPACDVQLEHAEIKPRHCFLQWIDGHLFCSDIGQNTGYFPKYDSQSNGRWIDHEPVTIGPYQFSLVGDSAAPRPDVFPLDRSARLAGEFPYLALQFDGVEQAENVWPVNRVLTMIGRAPQCKLRLNHQSMAFVQAALLRTSTGCWLMDLAQDGKTCVNGRPIQVSPIDIGDEIEFGAFRVSVVTMGTPSAVPAASGSPTNEKFGIPADKPLPPIRFNRPSSRSSGEPADASLVSTSIVAESGTAAVAVAEFDPEPDRGKTPSEEAASSEDIASSKPLPPIRFDRQPARSFESTIAMITPSPALAEPAIPATSVVEFDSERDPGKIVTEGRQRSTSISSSKPLPPIRFDRQPTRKSGEPPVAPSPVPAETAVVQASVTGSDPESRRDTMPTVQSSRSDAVVGCNEKLSKSDPNVCSHAQAELIEVATKTTGESDVTSENREQAPSVVTEPTDTASNEATTEAAKANPDASPALIAEFLKQQQCELDSLKKQLDQLKKIYDAAAGQLISKKIRDSLEKPVAETMQCYDSMLEKLQQFRKQTED